MKIELVSIAKKETSIYDPLYKDLIKMISRFAKVKDTEIFTKDVTKAHTISPSASQKAYTKVLESHISSCYSFIE